MKYLFMLAVLVGCSTPQDLEDFQWEVDKCYTKTITQTVKAIQVRDAKFCHEKLGLPEGKTCALVEAQQRAEVVWPPKITACPSK